jgi:hypothetical protein
VKYRWMWLFVGSSSLVVLGIAYFQSTYVSGTEFNAATWEIRDFAFRRDPVTNAQFTGVSHRATEKFRGRSASTDSWSKLVGPEISAYFKSGSNQPPRWDLVRLHTVSKTSVSAGNASILVELLSARDRQYNDFWSTWSVNHPTLAARLWPAVQDLVEFGLYASLPELLELAVVHSKPSDFQVALNEHVQAVFLRHCERLAADGDSAVSRAAQTALTYGEHPEFQQYISR